MAVFTTNGMELLDLSTAPSLPGHTQQLGNQVDAFYGAKVANFAALTASGGKFPGQQIYLEDIATHAVWDGSAWKVPHQTGTGTVTSMPAAGTGKTITVDFDIPYPSGVVPVVVANGTFTNRNAYASGATNTGFDLTAVNNSGTQNVSFNYIAFG